MSEEKINAKKEESVTDKKTSSSVFDTTRVALNEAKGAISRMDRDIASQRAERERVAKEQSETARERMKENTRRATENAQRLASEREYGKSYKTRVSQIEKERQRAEKESEEERDTKRLILEKREREIEEHTRREAEVLNERRAKTERLLSLLTDTPKFVEKEEISTANTEAEEVLTEEAKTEEVAVAEPETVEAVLVEDDTELAEEKDVTEDTDTVKGEAQEPDSKNAENTEIIEDTEGIENTEKTNAQQKQEDGDTSRIVLSIPAVNVPIEYSEIEKKIEEECERERREHQHLKTEAIKRAGGVYADELRLIKEEEERYRRRLAEIRHKHYAQMREVNATAEMDGEANSYYEGDTQTFAPVPKTAGYYPYYMPYPVAIPRTELGVAPTYPDPVSLDGQRTMGVTNGGALPYVTRASTYPEVIGTGSYIPYVSTVDYSGTGYDLTDTPVSRKNVATSVDTTDKYAGLDGENLPYSDSDVDLSDMEEEEMQRVLSEYGDAQLSTSQDRAELKKAIGEAHKKEREILSRIKKLERKTKNASREEAIRLTVEKINLEKEICELAMDTLHSAVFVKSRADISRTKRWLNAQIVRYNSYIDEYEALTGAPMSRLSKNITRDILSGKLPRPIQNVYYVYEGDAVTDTPLALQQDATEDQLRFVKEYDEADRTTKRENKKAEKEEQKLLKAEKRESARQFAERMNSIKATCDKDVWLIKSRFEYNIAMLEAERDMKLYSFDLKPVDRDRSVATLNRMISKLKNNLSRAMRLEAEDNDRYYKLIIQNPTKEKVRKRARRDRLDAYKLRLEALISEREVLNARLLSLYGNPEGTKKGAKGSSQQKINTVKKRYARSIYRSQRRIAKRLEILHAPVDLKEKIFDLMNKKIESVAVIEGSRYKLRHLKLRGRARRDVRAEMQQAKRSVRLINKDITFLMKRAERHDQLYASDMAWVGWLVGVGVVLVIGFVVWYFAGDLIWQSIQGYMPK